MGSWLGLGIVATVYLFKYVFACVVIDVID